MKCDLIINRVTKNWVCGCGANGNFKSLPVHKEFIALTSDSAFGATKEKMNKAKETV